MTALRQLIACLLLCLIVPANAQTGQPTDAAHRADVMKIIRGLNTADLILRGTRIGLRNNLKDDPALLEEMLKRADGYAIIGRLEERLVPFVAFTFPKKQAATMAAFLDTPTGHKFADFRYQKAIDPSLTFNVSALSSDDRSALNALFADNDMSARLVQMGNYFQQAEFVAMFKSFITDENLDPMRDINAQLSDAVKSTHNDTGSSAPVDSTAVLHQPLVQLVQHMAQGSAAINQQYQQALADSGLQGTLKPEAMVQMPSIQSGKRALVTAQHALDKRQADFASLIDSSLKESRALDISSPALKKQFTDGWELGLSNNYAHQIAYGENQQRLLGLYQRILELAESNQQWIRFEDGKLVFNDPELLKNYNSLIEQLRQASQEEKDIVQRSQDAVKKSIDDLK